MKTDTSGQPEAGNDGGAKDTDFTVESFSVPFTEAPGDTTVKVDVAPVVPAADDGAAAAAAAAAASAAGDDGEQHAGTEGQAAAASAVAAKPAAGVKVKKKGPTLEQREGDLKKRVDRATFELRETERKIAERSAELARLATGQPAADAKDTKPAPGKTGTEAAADLVMPEPPKYRDYATDEEFDTAMAKYRTEMATYQAERERRLEDKITKGVESRFESTRTAASEEREQAAVLQVLTTVRAKHEDWAAKAEVLKDITSSWYDSTKHGEARTPFLSDLAKNQMAAGNEEGAELLYFLGSDPDRAQVLADLLPSRPMRDALVTTDSILPLLDYFATEEGFDAFGHINRMHPVRLTMALGALSARLATAPGDSVAAAQPVTKAVLPAKSPVGTPGARGAAPAGTPPPFEDWMAQEDAKEQSERKKLAGIAV